MKKKYIDLLYALTEVKELYGLVKCEEIVDQCLKNEFFDLLDLNKIKEVYGDEGKAKCSEIIFKALMKRSIDLLYVLTG